MLISGNQRRSRPAELGNVAIKVKHTAKYFAGLDILLSVSSRMMTVNLRLIVTLAPSLVPTIATAGAVTIVFDSIKVNTQTLSAVVCLGGVAGLDDHVDTYQVVVVKAAA